MRGIKNIKALAVGSVLTLGAFFAFNAVYSETQAAGCSSNSVIKCGVFSVKEMRDKYNKDYTKGTKTIYSHLGVTSYQVNSATVKSGTVYRNGKVVVGGKTVADNAVTAGRWNIPGSKKVTKNGTTFYTRTPQVSFKTKSQFKAYVFFDSKGKFMGGVLLDCGNPFTARNKVVPPKPVYTCNDLKASKISRTKYKFTASASSKNGAKFKDYQFKFGDGSTKTSTTRIVSHTYKKAGTYTATVTPRFIVNGKTVSAKANNNCKVTVKVDAPAPKPSYVCTDLAATKISRTEYKFTGKAAAKDGARLAGYNFNFGDGKTKKVATSKTPATTTHTYAKPGTYTATVTPYFTLKGKTVNAPANNNCKVTVKVEAPAPKPVYACEGLQQKTISRNERTFTASSSAKNGAKLKDYSFDFGDGKKTTQSSATVNHTYATAGTYTATVTANFTVNGKTVTNTNANCKVTVKVKEEEKNPGVSINKTVNGVEKDVVDVNEPFTYELLVTNTGDQDLTNAVVSDEQPAGVTFQGADKGTIANGAWTYTIPELKVGATMTFKITAVVAEYVEGDIKNTACVDANEVPGTPDDCDDATVEVPEPKMVQVCNPETGEIITVKEDEADQYVPVDSPECEDASVEVCNPETGEIITVKPSEETNYAPVDSDECKDAPVVPETPEAPVEQAPVITELPKTGLAGALNGILGLGTLTAASYYYLASRRN